MWEKRAVLIAVILGLAFSWTVACGNGGDGSGADSDTDGDTDNDTDSDGDGDPITSGEFPSPMPPGNLDPEDAPQIIVFGFDDCMFTGNHENDLAQASDNGMNFVKQTFGPMVNPDGSDVHVSFFVNGAYMPNTEVGGPWGSETDLTVNAANALIAEGFELGNHTFDHLETNGTWGQIPTQWATSSLGGWAEGVGTLLPKDVWTSPVISFNDNFLKMTLGQTAIYGFRAPRLEINDQGLQALQEYGYEYDANMEEGHQWEYVTAAVTPGTDSAGFKWTVWPYKLDHGSPGVWQSQDFGEKDYIKDYPTGLWEVPVYMLYVPDNGLQETIAERVKTEITSEDMSWVGDKVREITSFDFNTFIYFRLTKDEFLEVMKYNFLLRYNGNRAPLTFGGHPGGYSWRYDNEVILGQPNNADYVDVLNYNTWDTRKAAIKEFIAWVDTNYGDDVYYMSSKELVDYMQNPFDKDGTAVTEGHANTPSMSNFVTAVGDWAVENDALGSNASYTVDGNSLDIDFTVGQATEDAGDYCFVDIAASFTKGALSNVSHIELVYEAEEPFRLRLLPDASESAIGMQVLLAGVGGERTAKIRVKDFRPDPYENASSINSQGFVDSSYMAKVAGFSIENAATSDNLSYNVKIKSIVFHGLSESDL